MRTKRSPFMQSFDRLPQSLAIFPLPNVVLLPKANLPLNIFEPRYLNMVQDAMRSNQLIGMIQPREDSDPKALCDVGCAGRITHYRETDDARLEIVLSGLCRFTVIEELPTVRGYRLVQPDWSTFAGDYEEQSVDQQVMGDFRGALNGYLTSQEIELDWDMMEKLDAGTMISNLVMALPLAAAEKQRLVEATTLEQRIRLFGALMETAQDKEATRH